MSRSIGKTIVLSILVLTSIYQIAMLWFDYPSDRNFFLSIMDTETTFGASGSNQSYDLFYPRKVATYYQTNEGSYFFENLDNPNNITPDSLFEIVKQALENGVVSSAFVAQEDLWSKGHLLLEMPFTIDITHVREAMKIESTWFKESMRFDRVYVYPGEFADDYMTIIFADASLKTRFSCQIPVGNIKQLNDMTLEFVEKIHGQDEIRYISTKQRAFNRFENDVLLPAGGQYFDLMQNIYGEKYFYDGDERDMESLETYVDYYFLNPEIAWSTVTVDEAKYGDLEVVVSYNKKGLLSYSFIDQLENKATDLGNAYRAAIKFTEKDTILNQIEYELVKYDQTDDEVTFYFDYEYRGVPIHFDNLQEDIGITHPMEISVTGNTVISYKRLLWKTEEVLIQGDPFEVLYQRLLDRIVPEIGDLKILDTYIAYYSEGFEDGAYLKWLVEVSDEKGVVDYELE